MQLLLQQDVVLGDVAEDQGHLGAVFGVLENMAGQLVHGRDTGATGDQADVVMLVGLPGVLGEGALERQALVDVHGVQVLGHGAARVGLDHELEVAGGI